MTTEPTKNGTPVLRGYVDRRPAGADLRVWCRWCCHWHIHGLTGSTGDLTHRIAHCYATDSAYRERGYWIEITNTPYSAVKGLVQRATAAQRRALAASRVSAAVKALREQTPPAA